MDIEIWCHATFLSTFEGFKPRLSLHSWLSEVVKAADERYVHRTFVTESENQLVDEGNLSRQDSKRKSVLGFRFVLYNILFPILNKAN